MPLHLLFYCPLIGMTYHPSAVIQRYHNLPLSLACPLEKNIFIKILYGYLNLAEIKHINLTLVNLWGGNFSSIKYIVFIHKPNVLIRYCG